MVEADLFRQTPFFIPYFLNTNLSSTTFCCFIFFQVAFFVLYSSDSHSPPDHLYPFFFFGLKLAFFRREGRNIILYPPGVYLVGLGLHDCLSSERMLFCIFGVLARIGCLALGTWVGMVGRRERVM
jgi:hypothetical protein